MINHLYLRSMLPVLGLAGSMAHAQSTTTAPTDQKKPTNTTTTTTKTTAPAAAQVTPRQDQFPKASGRSALPPSDKIPATAPTGSASASDAAQKKHIAGVKYEDRSASTLDAGSKDAAKAPVTTLDGASKDAPK
jgi:glucose/arabinose dehydrogenase